MTPDEMIIVLQAHKEGKALEYRETWTDTWKTDPSGPSLRLTMSSETWNSADAYADGYLGPEEDVETVKCKCGHECHYTEASEGYELCCNCADELEEAKP